MAVIETMTFELLPSVNEVDYIEFDEQVQANFFYRQPGVVRRTLAHGETRWLAETWWQSLSDAIAASEEFTADEHHATFISMVDEQSISVSRYETV